MIDLLRSNHIMILNQDGDNQHGGSDKQQSVCLSGVGSWIIRPDGRQKYAGANK
jgi:hypothetical protein